MSLRIAIAGLAAASLAACGSEESEPAQQAAAGGKILDRSITDDMLPYDTVRSQPPLSAPEKAEGESGGGSGSTAASASAPAESAADGEEAAPEAAAPENATPDAE